MEEYLGKVVEVTVDRPMGSKHPEHGFVYPINYGYIEGTMAADGEEIDAYVLGVFEPVEKFRGRVIGIIKRKNDVEDKLVVAQTLNSYNTAQIKALTEFQERFFDSEIICCSVQTGEPKIRPIVLGLARRGNDILVEEDYDIINDQYFYRFLGGGIEFREESEEALVREFKEELNADIDVNKYLCTLENIYTFEKRKGHEIVIVYEIDLPKDFYEKDVMERSEDNMIGKAMWIDKNIFLNDEKILYPAEIKKYL